jgi:hypothetical protein
VPSGRNGAADKQRRINMSDTQPTPTTAGKSPSHFAYQVREREGKKAIWTRIGSAWSHGDSKGFNVQLDAVPVDGRITLRTVEDKKE